MLNTRVWVAVVCAGLLTSAVSVQAQNVAQRRLASIDAQRGVDTNPYNTPEDVAAGKKHFNSRCAVCHGPDGRGNRGPDLTRNVYRHGNSDRAIFMNILSGIAGTGMPSIRLSDREMWQIVAYVGTLRRPAGDAAPGDPLAGRELFARHDCGRCHFVDGVGGRLGPDLSAVGWSRSAAHLRASVLDPTDDVEDNQRQIVVTDDSGEQTRACCGTRMRTRSSCSIARAASALFRSPNSRRSTEPRHRSCRASPVGFRTKSSTTWWRIFPRCDGNRL